MSWSRVAALPASLALLTLGLLVANADEPRSASQSLEHSMHISMRKDPGCGCCDIWAEHLRAHGFTVDSTEDPDLFEYKEQRGIPRPLMSCHTAEIDGYFVEGHVPAGDILLLLKAKPEGVTGIGVPGMPLGSPGMEHPRPQSFKTIAIAKDGDAYVFAEHAAGEDFTPARD